MRKGRRGEKKEERFYKQIRKERERKHGEFILILRHIPCFVSSDW